MSYISNWESHLKEQARIDRALKRRERFHTVLRWALPIIVVAGAFLMNFAHIGGS
jgi:ABC-type maltose transport system permease subunit